MVMPTPNGTPVPKANFGFPYEDLYIEVSFDSDLDNLWEAFGYVDGQDYRATDTTVYGAIEKLLADIRGDSTVSAPTGQVTAPTPPIDGGPNGTGSTNGM